MAIIMSEIPAKLVRPTSSLTMSGSKQHDYLQNIVDDNNVEHSRLVAALRRERSRVKSRTRHPGHGSAQTCTPSRRQHSSVGAAPKDGVKK